MATLPIMQAGLPDMASQGIPQQGIPQQPMQPTADPSMQPYDIALQMMQPVVDDDTLDQFTVDASGLLANNQTDLTPAIGKAVDKSFTNGVNNLSKTLGSYVPSDFKTQMQTARSSLQTFLKDKNNTTQAIDQYRKDVKPLSSAINKIRHIATRADKGRFLDTMREANDDVVNQVLSDIIQSNPNGLVAVEYLTSGFVPKGVPQPLIEREADNLWNQFNQAMTTIVSNQIESLLQRDIAAFIRMDTLKQSQGNPQMLQQAATQNMGPMQSKIQQIQQINASVFNTQPQTRPADTMQPIQPQSLSRFTRT